MNQVAFDAPSTPSPDPGGRGPGNGGSSSPATPPDIVAQRLIAVPWRHAGLIALFALAGGLATTTLWPHPAPVHLVAVTPHLQAIHDAPPASAAGIALRLELEPGPAVAGAGASRSVDALQASSGLRLDEAGATDAIDALLRHAPPAAGRLLHESFHRAGTADGERPRTTLPGLVAGLMLGLLVAGLRELRGERMRSPREAQWALGAPVLGTIPTLSAKARGALLEPPLAVPDSA